MTEPTPADTTLPGSPPPAVEPAPPTEHVEKPKHVGRVFTADTNELATQVSESAPDTAAEVETAQPQSAEVAVAQQAGPLAVAEQDWPHDFMDFEGDRLEIRLPDERALTGFALSVGKYIPAEVQNDMVSLFMNRHMSPDSYGQVMARMMSPDDPSYTTKTVGQLFNSIVKAAGEVRAEEAKASAAAEKQGK